MPVVQLVVDAAEAELAADALWRAGPSAVGEEVLADGRVRLTADVADLDAVPAAWAPVVVDLEGTDHLDAWREWAVPQRAGRHVVLHPSWRSPGPVEPGDVVVPLDPGRTFGSGSHASTRLVVAAIEAHLRPGDHVLDVGAGSGVLAVVAARLGASAVLAVDVDPLAPAATEANARANGVAGVVRAATTPLADVTGRFDLVLANIGVRVLSELAGALVARVAPGGLLVLAGLLDDQVDGLVDRAFSALDEVQRSSIDGWCAVVLRATGRQGLRGSTA